MERSPTAGGHAVQMRSATQIASHRWHATVNRCGDSHRQARQCQATPTFAQASSHHATHPSQLHPTQCLAFALVCVCV